MHENRLRELRETRGVSQHELGRRLGMSQMQISKYERGLAQIPGWKIAAFCKFFGVTTREIFCPPPTDAATDEHLTLTTA